MRPYHSGRALFHRSILRTTCTERLLSLACSCSITHGLFLSSTTPGSGVRARLQITRPKRLLRALSVSVRAWLLVL